MTVLALLRHGETEWTSEGRIQGRTDVPLSQKGRAEMALRSIPDEFRDFHVVTSPLSRCVETALALGIKGAGRDDRLAEMAWGEWEGHRLRDLRAHLGESMRLNESLGFDFTPPGGESPRQVLARISGLLADIRASGRPTMAVSHRGVIRVVFASAFDWDMLGRPPVRLDWSALHLFNLDVSGVPSVLKLNVPLLRMHDGEVAS
jgi:broad specificity phosphatase PhoE